MFQSEGMKKFQKKNNENVSKWKGEKMSEKMIWWIQSLQQHASDPYMQSTKSRAIFASQPMVIDAKSCQPRMPTKK